MSIRPARFTALALSVLLLFATAKRGSATAPTLLAPTPPMGWSSWNYFNDRVTDGDIRQAADALVSSGMRDAGYTYVNIDDSWQGQRDAQGFMHPNARFPDMKALVDYVHHRGLRIGIYSSPGPKTCDKFPGSYGYEIQDAKTFVDWGFDYLKYDLCTLNDVIHQQAPNNPAAQKQLMIDAYRKMNAALRSETQATGRPSMVFSLCQYGLNDVWTWAPDVGGSLWRTTYDIYPIWDRMVMIAEAQNGLEAYAGPGHWNDPDLLIVGNGRFNLTEDRTHFSWWAILAAPLIAGNNLPTMNPDIRSILTQKDVIAIDQDPLGRQGKLAYRQGFTEVWTRDLSGGAIAIAIINTAGPVRLLAILPILAAVLVLTLILVGPKRKIATATGAVVLGLLLLVLLRKEGIHQPMLPLYVAWAGILFLAAVNTRLSRRLSRHAAQAGFLVLFVAGFVVMLNPEAGSPTHAPISYSSRLVQWIQSAQPFQLDLRRIGLSGPQSARNVWTGENLSLTQGQHIKVSGHDVLLVRIDHPALTLTR